MRLKLNFTEFSSNRAFYIQNTMENESTCQKFALLKSLLGKEDRQLPRYESKQALASA